MRLYDEIMAARGGLLDKVMGGSITTFCKLLSQAQCFVISDPIAHVCADVCQSRPSSILSAMDMIRAPFPFTWIEWSTQRPYSVDNDKPVPSKLGALLVTNEQGSKGYFILAWMHATPPEISAELDGADIGVTVCPLGLIYDWDSASTEPVFAQFGASVGMGELAAKASERKRAGLQKSSLSGGRWARFDQVPTEREAVFELEMRAELIPLDFCSEFLVKAGAMPGSALYENYCGDLAGELPFIEAFLLLLNSRNSIIEQTRDDFTRLNKARAKNRRPPLKEFINTNIRLSRVQYNRLGTANDRAAARAHMVRGHFKIRRSGVYWWSAFARGQGAQAPRGDYRVK